MELLSQTRAEILDEIRTLRDDQLATTAEALVWDFDEIVSRGLGSMDQTRLDLFFHDSLFVLTGMREVLMERDLASAYRLAPAYNHFVWVRAVAMKLEGKYQQADFQRLYESALEVNHRLVGVRNVRLDEGWNAANVRGSRMWQYFTDNWFRVPNQPFVFCSCNVWEWRCAPTGRPNGGYCIQNWEYLLPPKASEYEQMFNKDGVIQIIRTTLEQLQSLGQDRVITEWGPGTIWVV